MPTNYIANKNKLTGHPRFAPGVNWYYPVPDTLTRQQAIDLFNSDQVKESKLLDKLPAASAVGRVWRIKAAAVVGQNTVFWWIGRNAAPAGQNGQISIYYDAPAGLSLQSRLLDTQGNIVSTAPLVYDANGYARPGLIDPARTEGLPKYAALHQNIASMSAVAQVINTANARVLRQEAVALTDTGPNSALLSAPPDPPPSPPAIPTPTPTPTPNPTPGIYPTETYAGVFVSAPGLASNPSRLLLAMTGFDTTTLRGTVSNTVTRNPDNGREFRYSVNGSNWLNQAGYNTLRFGAGVPYLVTMIEPLINDTNPFEIEKRCEQQGYSPAEHSFIIH